jgi:hypothetical protein
VDRLLGWDLNGYLVARLVHASANGTTMSYMNSDQGVTEHPTAAWTAQQMIEAFP